MIKVKNKDLNNLRKLFKDIRFYMGNSVLDGKMGYAYADNTKSPSFAFLVAKERYCFISGKVDDKQLKKVINEYELYKYKLIPSDEIKEMLENEFKETIEKSKRYSIKKNTVFDTCKLNSYINNYKFNYEFLKIDEELANRIRNEEFINIADNYKEYGIGYCCMNNNEIIGVASSNIVYKDGIEVNIKVKEEYRKQGIATILASKLILECLRKNKTVSWDAANLNSVGLAKKLGFEYDSEYDIYCFKNNELKY